MKKLIKILTCIILLNSYFSDAAETKSVIIKDVPHVTQKPDFCGEACVEMYLKKLGFKITQDDVFNLTEVNPMEGRGAYSPDLRKALLKLGFQPGKSWHKVKADSKKEIKEKWQDIYDDLKKGTPSLVCMNTVGGTEHIRLILGYDSESDCIIYHEPGDSDGRYNKMKLAKFMDLWPLKYKKDQWTLVSMSLKYDKLKMPDKKKRYTDADFAQHIMELKRKIPKGKGFSIHIQPPFVVIGDEKPEMVKARSKQTVKWAVHRLKKAYFKKDPEDIIDIWLFKDKTSYEKHCKEIFNEAPDTPYGFSSPKHKALIMNIATGGGTLVHEIVHPFVRSNFPDCPSWLNEGLGSLYEQCGGKGDKIFGYTNWRLAGLKKFIKAGKLLSFKELTSTTDFEFYNKDKGSNYSQSRYLCYYLQEKELLNKFYHEFYKNRKKDPTGYNTLKKILDTDDMDKFQKDWEKYVMKLQFP